MIRLHPVPEHPGRLRVSSRRVPMGFIEPHKATIQVGGGDGRYESWTDWIRVEVWRCLDIAGQALETPFLGRSRNEVQDKMQAADLVCQHFHETAAEKRLLDGAADPR